MENLNANSLDITQLSIGQMAEHLTTGAPNPRQLEEFMTYVDSAEDPQLVAKELFIAYTVAQCKLSGEVSPNDLIVTAQSYLRGFREDRPLEERHRELFPNDDEYHHSTLALRGLRKKCMKPKPNSSI